MLNKVLLMGRLTRDPEVRYTANNNTLVCSFSLAVGRNFKREGQPDADFINIVAWGKTGEFSSKYFKKGLQVAVVGRLQNRSYEDSNGQKKYITEVIAEEVYFADSNNRQTADASILNSPVNTQTEDDGTFMSEDSDLPF